MNFSQVKNLVFDLGGVIINIDFAHTFKAFAQLGNISPEQVVARFEGLNIMQAHETGNLTDMEFRDMVRQEISKNLSDEQIDIAWNALLMDIPPVRIELLKALRNNYNLFLLSNTNHIHIVEVNKTLEKSSGTKDLKMLFDKVYYSYEIGLRKPNSDIYEYLLKDLDVDPKESVFLDDNLDNVNGAIGCGIPSIHVKESYSILEIFKDAKKA